MTYLEQYANAVLNGEITACRRVKQVYKLLLDKLHHPEKYRPWVFDEEKASRPIEFIETFCRQAQGKLGTPLKLELFQKAKLQAVFGFVDQETGLRQYREVLTIEGRKNGKTTECAAVELYLLVADNEGSPEIYNIATKLDQAKKGYHEAWKMVQQSADLHMSKKNPIGIKKRQSDLYFPYNMGIIQALASNSNSLDGLNSHGVFIDELEAIKNRDIYDLMKQSTSSREQPLIFCNSTNGFIRDCIFDSQYEYACRVLDGAVADDRFLPFIYELDNASEWDKEECWIKANPGLGAIKKLDTLRGYVQKAKDDSGFKPTVLVKDFNLKQTGSAAWLRYEEFNNEATFDVKEFDYCIGAFDAADTTDLNAAKAICARPDDDHVYVKSMYWMPQEVFDRMYDGGSRTGRDNVPYDIWKANGFLRLCPGNKVDKRVFLDWFLELRDEGLFALYFGYDPWHIDDSLLRDFKSEFGEDSMIPIRQGVFSLSNPMKELKADLAGGKVIYGNNPIDKWCFANTQIKTDINGNIQPVKGLDPRCRIDGTVALICGYKVLKDKADSYVSYNRPAQ